MALQGCKRVMSTDDSMQRNDSDRGYNWDRVAWESVPTQLRRPTQRRWVVKRGQVGHRCEVGGGSNMAAGVT
ncbi:unnamed protein product [Lampetra fluviatilis]